MMILAIHAALRRLCNLACQLAGYAIGAALLFKWPRQFKRRR